MSPVTTRHAAQRLLWAGVRKLPGGEDTLRALVAQVNDRDGTNADSKETDGYSSTKRLTDVQLAALAEDVRRRVGLPPASKLPRGPRGGKPRRPTPIADPETTTFIASDGERVYVEYLFRLLGWEDNSERAKFVERQTRGIGLRTHRACIAVTVPLERMLRERGFIVTEKDHVKTWARP
ncbi:MAG TPA: hypothetical protein VKP14_06230 [Gaiellaceae bacterium]|nr:hypothetical protein [Gaiellaceae bacterium]